MLRSSEACVFRNLNYNYLKQHQGSTKVHLVLNREQNTVPQSKKQLISFFFHYCLSSLRVVFYVMDQQAFRANEEKMEYD